ncbi:hypothetical protein [Rubellimicrobium sp. CFH 75288]|uniref:hypothetical protein n=1 Tax=Rubellimicrobium sp. CFH 75288 TaxID=2697034 RepID=UPI001411C775|nr:hypothetical protein [Rubellimicrobium sp. CFH 75288]NAZ35909.1 hypothetical protein [Rubellimicrobium sp. CFH 75288]
MFERGVDGLRGFADELRGEVEQWSEGLAGITEEMLPVFRMLAREMGPALVEVFRQIDSIENYESPILTPEGDIVIRRRPDAPPFTPPRTEPAPEADGVDL